MKNSLAAAGTSSANPKPKSPLASLLGALTAILTIATATLYYTGYLFLLGFYAHFSIPIGILDIPFHEVVTESGTVILPLLGFVAIVVLGVYLLARRSNNPKAMRVSLSEVISILKAPGFYLFLVGFGLALTFTMPPTGRSFARTQVEGGWMAYSLLAPPLPRVTLFAKEPIPGLPGEKSYDFDTEFYVYPELRLLGRAADLLYVYHEESQTFSISHELIVSTNYHQQSK